MCTSVRSPTVRRAKRAFTQRRERPNRIAAAGRPRGLHPATAVPVEKRPKHDAPAIKKEPTHTTDAGPSGKGLPPSAAKVMAEASIGDFGRQKVQLPTQHRSYNDDVEVGGYKPPVSAYACEQRRGIRGNFESRASMRERVSSALRGPFPMSAETPMPRGTLGADIYSRDCPPGQIRSFRASRLWGLGKMVRDSELAQGKRGDAIPDGGIRQMGSSKPSRLAI